MRVSDQRPQGAWLAGACAGLAKSLGWNVWAIRGLFLLGLWVKPLVAGGAYLLVALLLGCMPGVADRKSAAPGGLGSPDLAHRSQRIEALERKFRDLERGSN